MIDVCAVQVKSDGWSAVRLPVWLPAHPSTNQPSANHSLTHHPPLHLPAPSTTHTPIPLQLLVVGAAKDLRQRPAVRHMAPAAYDLMVGGLAGTVAVLVSMPFDVIKTYIQTHGALEGAAAASSGAVGISGSAGQFWSTGKALVARSGPKALFVGLAPRLAHQVPGKECGAGGVQATAAY
jgi:hypothetical protein